MRATPSGASASDSAFDTAAIAPTVPASPAPLMPSVLVLHGTLRNSISNDGKSDARGIA